MMKNKKILIPIAILLLIIGATLVKSQLNTMEQQEKISAELKAAQADTDMQLLMHEEYPGVPENNNFIRENPSEIIDRFEGGTGVIFLGFKECPWCQKTAPLINQAAGAAEVPVYYVDIRKEREDSTPEYQEITSILSPYLATDEAGKPIISTPDISFVRNGEIVGRFELEETTEAKRTPESYWTEDRKERAVQNFREQMERLKKG